MSIAKKAMIALTAALITAGFSSESFAIEMQDNSFEGSSTIDSNNGSRQVVCFYLFGGRICVSG
jgi:hypothetical protein